MILAVLGILGIADRNTHMNAKDIRKKKFLRAYDVSCFLWIYFLLWA